MQNEIRRTFKLVGENSWKEIPFESLREGDKFKWVNNFDGGLQKQA